MPINISRHLNDAATWWPVTGSDGFGGDTFGTPVLVDCRWEDRTEVYIGQLDRRETISKAIILLDRDVSVGDYLARGDQTAQSNPTLVAGAHKVQRFDKLTDLRSVSTVRKAIL